MNIDYWIAWQRLGETLRQTLLSRVEPDYERARRQMIHYLDDELVLGLEGELGGIVDWDWLVKAVVDVAIGGRLLVSGGERVEWCVEHGASVVASLGGCGAEQPPNCRIVSRLLVDPPKEEK